MRPTSNTPKLDEFGGRGEDELIMLPRDKIELIELDEGFGDAWYYGKNLRTGQTGLFPASMRPPLQDPLTKLICVRNRLYQRLSKKDTR